MPTDAAEWLVGAVFCRFVFSAASFASACFFSFILALTVLAFAALFFAAGVFALAEPLPAGFAPALLAFTLAAGSDAWVGDLMFCALIAAAGFEGDLSATWPFTSAF